jgi:hypothetical protein
VVCGSVLRRAHAEAPGARLRPCSTPKHPKTAGRVESVGGPVSPGLGRAPDSPEVSAADRRDPAAGLRHRRATDAGAGTPGSRGPRPLRAASPAGAGVMAGGLAAPAAPPRVVSRPGRRRTLVPPCPPNDRHSGGAPAWQPQRCRYPSAAARLGDPSAGTRGVAARHAGTAGPPEPQDHGPLPPLTPPTLDLVHATSTALMADR